MEQMRGGVSSRCDVARQRAQWAQCFVGGTAKTAAVLQLVRGTSSKHITPSEQKRQAKRSVLTHEPPPPHWPTDSPGLLSAEVDSC